MRRDQLEHAIRTVCQVIGRPEVIVVGSHRGTRRCSHFPADISDHGNLYGSVTVPRDEAALHS
jgi:hypothetical protein